MNCELAKQLKDAGFPQKTPREPWCKKCDSFKAMSCFDDKHDTEYIMFPTLSELIEACGKDFVAVGREFEPTNWRASTIKYSGFGKTPEEAVANLWLELNKK